MSFGSMPYLTVRQVVVKQNSFQLPEIMKTFGAFDESLWYVYPPPPTLDYKGSSFRTHAGLQGYLTHMKPSPPRTLQ